MTEAQVRSAQPHRVVIVGAGFGGLEAAFRLSGTPVSITLIDRRNHHLFQPLLYQVATASLATSEIAWPIRYLLRDRPDVTTLYATVTGVDANAKRVLLDDGDGLPYDTLILAKGARRADRGRAARAGRLCRRSLGLCAALSGKYRRRSEARTGRHRMHRRQCRLRRQPAGYQNHHLGRRRARLARRRMARRTG